MIFTSFFGVSEVFL